MAQFVWWIVNPSLPDIYVEKTTVNQFDNNVKQVISRYPFGVITVPKVTASAVAPIASLVTLTGVYINTPKNSMAFIQYNKKPMVLKVGDTIADNAVVTSVTTDGIKVKQGNSEATINMTIKAATNGSPPIYNAPANNMFQPQNNFNRAPSPVPQNNAQPQPNNDIGLDPNSNEFKERRKKLIEEFAQRANGATASNAPAANNDTTINGATNSSAPTTNNP